MGQRLVDTHIFLKYLELWTNDDMKKRINIVKVAVIAVSTLIITLFLNFLLEVAGDGWNNPK